MDKVNPFIYYLASKYQNFRERKQKYEIKFDVEALSYWGRDVCVLSDYKLRTYPNKTEINITKQELDDYTEEDIKTLINNPFYRRIALKACYYTRVNFLTVKKNQKKKKNV